MRVPRSLPSGRSLGVTELLAVLLPLACLLSLLLVGPAPAERPAARPARTTSLPSSSLVCPTSTAGGEVAVATDSAARGSVLRSSGDGSDRWRVSPHRVSSVADPGTVQVTGRGELAPALVAGRSTASGPLSAVDCPAPGADLWFTGVGAAAKHASTLELHNPDPGRAIVSVLVLRRRGPSEPPRLQGLAVAGRSTQRIELAEVLPQRGVLALHVVSGRGRVAATVLDGRGRIGPQPSVTEYLPAQTSPGRDALLLGVLGTAGGQGSARAALDLANPTDSEVRVQPRLVTADSTFVPSGAEPVVVPAQSVTTVPLTRLLSGRAARGAVGLQLAGTGTFTAAVHVRTERDLALVTPGGPVSDPTLLTLPAGEKRLVLGGAEAPGKVRVEAWSADGERLQRTKVDLAVDVGVGVDLPREAALVRVTPAAGSALHGAVVVESPSGSAVLVLRQLSRSTRVPQVSPTLR